jgi:hypothetical protein
MGGRDLKSGDGLPLLNPFVRFTCGGHPLVNLLNPATASYVQKAAAAEGASTSSSSSRKKGKTPVGNSTKQDHDSVLYTGEYGKHGPVPKK